MRWIARSARGAGVLVLLVALPMPAWAQATPGPCEEADRLPHGARALICVPALGWNGQLVVYAHG